MRLRLSTQLILSVVLIEAMMLSALVWNSVRLINSSHGEILEQTTREASILLANSLAPGLAFSDSATLLEVLAMIKNNKNLNYATVYDRNNNLIASLGEGIRDVHLQDSVYNDAVSDGIFDYIQPVMIAGQNLGNLHVGYSIDQVEQITAKTRFQNTMIACIALFLSIMATVFIGLFLTRNLRFLEEGAKALSRGELDYRIRLSGQDEVGDLARAFNKMGEYLQKTQSALRFERDKLKKETRYFHSLLGSIDAVVIEFDPQEMRFVHVSQEVERLVGFSVECWLEKDFYQRAVFDDDVASFTSRMAQTLHGACAFTLEFRMYNQIGEVIWIRCKNTLAVRDGRQVVRGLMFDITEQKASEERVVYLADHDSLTGLINRRRFQEELERQISYSQRYNGEGALLFIDLDQFKYINDTYGHRSGDAFLVNVANRLKSALRKTDILGRLGGDEFGVILPKADKQEAGQVAAALLHMLTSEPLEHEGTFSHASASIGVTLYPAHGDTPSELLAKADAAMYGAKNSGRARFHIFTSDEQDLVNMHAKIHWEDRIRSALAQDKFLFHYQPVVDLVSGQITHYEALLRMEGEKRGLVAPGAFLGTAERFGLIREIDHWVLRNAIKAQGQSRADGRPITLAVNISGKHFGSTEVLGLVKECLQEYDADPHSLIFEVTETAAVENLSAARRFITSLRELGCQFALDDFGAGFASFHYLKNLPVNYIKIDGSFVRNVHNDEADRIFVKSMSDLAKGLDIVCIAEFVENESVLAVLNDIGVHLGQGYHLARPRKSILRNKHLNITGAQLTLSYDMGRRARANRA